MVILGWKDDVEGTLVRELRPFSLSEKPEDMPDLVDPLLNLICGQIKGKHEFLFVCTDLQDVVTMFDALEANKFDRLVWYTGVTRFPPENMR